MLEKKKQVFHSVNFNTQMQKQEVSVEGGCPVIRGLVSALLKGTSAVPGSYCRTLISASDLTAAEPFITEESASNFILRIDGSRLRRILHPSLAPNKWREQSLQTRSAADESFTPLLRNFKALDLQRHAPDVQL